MSWKSFAALLAIVTCSTVLMAQNEPFLGVWEINLAKSNITRVAAPKYQAITNVAEPGGFRTTRASLNENGTSVEVHHYRFDGQFHQTEGGDPREISYKRVNPNTIERTTRRNGALTVGTEEVSSDGKTLTVNQPGNLRVFNRAPTGQGEPFLGIWVLNHAKSSFTRGAAPKSQTFVMIPEPGGFKSVRATISDTGMPNTELHHYNFDGKFHETEGGDQRALSFKRVDPNTIDETARRTRNGQVQVSERRIALSTDGKTMTITSPQPAGATDIRVYERQ
jgi:hypothetical protein